MADYQTAARPYARAMFEIAQDAGKLDDWQARIELAAAVADDEQMETLLEQTRILPRELGDLFLSILGDTELEPDADFDNSIRLLAENSRLRALPDIATEFAKLKRNAEDRIEVRVKSARELTEAQQKSIAKRMAKRLGKQVSLTTEIDDSLIAGAVIIAGDLVIDGSASGRIDKLRLAVNR